MTDAIYDSEFVPPGFSLFRKDRGSKGGGVCIVFKSSLKIQKMPDVPNIECIFCKVNAGKVSYVLGGMYRPPTSATTVLDELHDDI